MAALERSCSHSSKEHFRQRVGAATQALYSEKRDRIDALSSSDDAAPMSSFPSAEESDVSSDADSNEDANCAMSAEDGSSATQPTTGRNGSGK